MSTYVYSANTFQHVNVNCKSNELHVSKKEIVTLKIFMKRLQVILQND